MRSQEWMEKISLMAIDLTIRRLLNFFIVLFVLVTGMLVYWQVDQAQALTSSPYHRCISTELPVRGSIYDRSGVLLAWSEPDATSPCGWRRRYATDAAAIQDATAQGLIPKGHTEQPHPSISSFLGYFSYIYGSTGIENYYNDVLTGSATAATQNFDDSYNQFMNGILHARVYGSDIYLAIDVNIQDELDKIFSAQVTGGSCTSGSAKGSIIVENPRNGEILGMLSRPYYNADAIGDMTAAHDDPTKTVSEEYWNQLNTDANDPLVNRALLGNYVTGSIFKAVTMAAGLDSGKLTPDTSYSKDEATTYTVSGRVFATNELGGYANGPVPPSFPMDLAHAFAYSDNVIFARAGMQTGSQIWLDYTKRFYMSTPDDKQDIPIDISPAPRSYVYTNGQFADVDLAASSFGQGQLLVAPITMAMVTSAVANDGQMAMPHFLYKVVPHGAAVASTPVTDANLGPPRTVFSGTTAQYIKKAMRDVVTFGSVGASGGSIAAIANLSASIGGKTGTGQLGDGNPHAWFISLAPDNVNGGGTPQLASVIMKERGGEGACQAPIAGKLYQYALPIVSKYPDGG